LTPFVWHHDSFPLQPDAQCYSIQGCGQIGHDVRFTGKIAIDARSRWVIGEDVYQVLSLEGSLASRNHTGCTAPDQVAAAIVRARKSLEG